MTRQKHVYDSDRIIRSLEDGFLRADIDGYIVMANEAIAAISGYSSPEEMIGLHMNKLYANPEERDYMISEIKSKGKLLNCQLELLRQDGSRFWSLNNIKMFYDEKGNLLGTEGVIRDITTLREIEKKLEHANKVLAAIRNMNQLISVEKDTAKLMQGICDNLTQNRGYHNVWIMLLDEKGNFESFYQTGLGKEFKQIEKKLKKGDFTGCALKTLSQKNVVVINDPKEECSDCPLAELYGDRGAMTAPIIHNDKLFGLITASIPKKYLTQYDFDLLKEVGDDIGLALDNIETTEQSRRLSEVVNSLPQPISLVSRDYRYMAVNYVYAEFFQASVEEITGAKVSEFLGEEIFTNEVKPNLDRCLQGEVVKYELQTEFAGKGNVWMHMEYHPYYEKNGKITAVMSHGFDITERKKSEEQLKALNQQLQASEQQLRAANQQLQANEQELQASNQQLSASEQQLLAANQQLQASEQQLRAANQQLIAGEKVLRDSKETAERYLNIAAEIILCLDTDGNITLLNESGYQLLGYEVGELLKKDWFSQCIPEEVLKSIKSVFSQLMKDKSENVANYESNIITKSGEIRTILWHNTVLKDKKGKITGTLSSGEDITERKNSERQIVEAREKAEKSEKYLENIIKNLADPIFVKDEESKLLVVNDAFCQLFGLNKENIIGKDLAEDVSPAERESFLRIDKLVLNDGKENINEESLTVRGGLTKTISTKKSRFLDEKGRKFLVGIIRDITERKQSEIELKKAKEKAEESDRLKSAFLANMSHEIRTPMNGILGFTDLLREPGLSGEQQQRFIDIIQKSGDRMLSTVNDIIDISKIESGQVELSISKVNINEQLKELHSFFEPEAAKRGIKLTFKNDFPEQDIIINTDLDKFNSIVTNLIKNAIKYSDKGSIELGYGFATETHGRASQHSEGRASLLQFYVKDTGIGIPEGRQKAIFDRFIQADIEDKQAKQGSGLGLAISKAYVEMLGGKMWLESEKNVGSTFYFTIEYNSGAELKSITNNDEQILKEDKINGNLKILIVEDDETSQQLISIVVEKFAKKIIKVSSGGEAVEACRNNPDIDLILMDIQLPNMNGYEATRQIRQFNKDVIILAQTAYALAGDKEKAIDTGCNDYISKPINKSELDKLIKKYLMK